ncbi:STM4014 family protein [Streptomyces sp. WI04-05B]|uniref:STM4014 family protein n=1 Tax=Streptomyces TaxID=1883 RepID=UPI00299FAB1C|nr:MULTISPECIES: STM4014 family protein [unclassified Streptomyces]MDX2547431.1 STM4014 family protein [Streptomyces sp. WI04-05B]MDX2586310.1 STM4014 family protein [Streptomyces sp. WI04-05A]MDX3748960.1 STM4014 family protein [Streptomyces sp. AK08-02]
MRYTEAGSVSPRWAVVANGDNRRVSLFGAAARAAGHGTPRVVEWRDVLREGGHDFAADEFVRLDSPGESAEVDVLLRDVDDPTRVEGSARWYGRFLRGVASLRGGRRLDDPVDLAVMFDKRLCHDRLVRAGVPVPPSPTSGGVAPVRDWADVRARMAEAGLRRVFVKLAHGSSASGVLAIETTASGRIRATTSVERTGEGRLHNSLRVRRYTEEGEIAAIVDTLAPDGLHIERWLPKASLGGRSADLRIVVVGGRATHVVVRTSRSPLTNLHLGGARGDLAAVRALAGDRWATALETSERAAACFPGTLCVGVDLLPAVGWRRFAVGEVNAFGDLLPRLTGLPGSGAEGLDTYAAQVAAATSFAPGHFPQTPGPGPATPPASPVPRVPPHELSRTAHATV